MASGEERTRACGRKISVLRSKGIRELVVNIYIYLGTEGEGRGELGYILVVGKRKKHFADLAECFNAF